MFKVLILAALAIAGACAQPPPEGASGAAEPYAYAYQGESHQAQEQRSPDGKVTGFYSLIDPTDGRERRVEYVADENGFRAKVATNEVGTKSENPADVEMLASPPTEAQFAYQQGPPQAPPPPPPPPQQQQQQQQYYKQQVVSYQQTQQPSVTVSQAPPSVQQVGYFEQPAAGYSVGYGYYPGYGYQQAGYQTRYGAYNYQPGGNYNYHLPAQYYSNVQGAVVKPGVATYSAGPVGAQNVVSSRYVSSAVRTVPVGGPSSYTYSSGPVSSTTRTVTTTSGTSNLAGSGNLVLIKKK